MHFPIFWVKLCKFLKCLQAIFHYQIWIGLHYQWQQGDATWSVPNTEQNIPTNFVFLNSGSLFWFAKWCKNFTISYIPSMDQYKRLPSCNTLNLTLSAPKFNLLVLFIAFNFCRSSLLSESLSRSRFSEPYFWNWIF